MLQAIKKTGNPIEDLHFAGSAGILRTLAYFDIFHYPLTKTEIRQFLFVQSDEEKVEKWLCELEKEGKIFYNKGFYSLHDNPLLAYRRIRGNQKACVMLEKAKSVGRFLYQFPFVRAIAISGSLSKNFADEKADIDFFIITSKNCLWIARTFMHLYKKLAFLRGQEHFYCMNYYVDESALEIGDRNLFTATEVKTLLPVCGEKAMQHFFTTNDWSSRWLPACNFRDPLLPDPKPNALKRITEWLLSNRIGTAMNRLLLRITTHRWNHKAKNVKRNRKGAPMALITGLHFAKSNPGAFQERILKQYGERIEKLRK